MAQFHIDHVQPQMVGGETVLENLALACVACSLHKAARQTFADPVSGRNTQLFNPRQMKWDEHFRWDHAVIIGITEIGRATIAALKINHSFIVAIREEEIWLGRHPG